MSYSELPSKHRRMVFDHNRNSAYFRAIATTVNRQSRVLDLGAGVGVLGLEAARVGAQKVYLVDSSAVVHTASDIAKNNHLSERVEVLHAPLKDVHLEEKVDVILSVFTGNFLLEEDLLPKLFTARDRLLAPGGSLIPDRGRMQVAPVSLPAYYSKHIECWSQHNDLDYGAGREYAVNSAYFDSAEKFQAQLLGEPVCVTDLDFNTANKAECKAAVNLEFDTTQTCHGFLGWFDIHLGNEWLSTSPLAPATHWSQVFFPFRQPLQVEAGQSAALRLSRPQKGRWSWSVRFGEEQQAHSTAMAAPLVRSDFANRAASAAPSLNDKGKAIRIALEAMEGNKSIDEIAGQVMMEYPSVFESREDATETIIALAAHWAQR